MGEICSHESSFDCKCFELQAEYLGSAMLQSIIVVFADKVFNDFACFQLCEGHFQCVPNLAITRRRG